MPTAFWRDEAARVRAEFPDVVFIGEVIHGDYVGFIEESTLTRLLRSQNCGRRVVILEEPTGWELAHAIDRHADFCRNFIRQTFVGNHDVTRIATLVGPASPPSPAAILMSLPGAPSVYYGDEQGFTGTKRASSSQATTRCDPRCPTSPRRPQPARRADPPRTTRT